MVREFLAVAVGYSGFLLWFAVVVAVVLVASAVVIVAAAVNWMADRLMQFADDRLMELFDFVISD